jgi:Holliday junction DNA helicase RuvA
MIGRLKGVIDGYGEDWVLIDVGGVGYQVHCSSRSLAALPPVGEAAQLAIETFVREDQIRLFGFASDDERDWFRLLLGVQGVGTKVALAILSVLGPGDLVSAVALKDKAMVSRAQGVGPKVALRIVNELQGKAPLTSGAGGAALAGLAAQIDAQAPSAVADAVSALVNLGYPMALAGAAVATAQAATGEAAATQDLIRLALKELSR